MSHPDSRQPVRNPATASRVFSGEAVVITPSENTVRMFNTVGSRIWELIDGQRTIDEIVEALLDEYAVTPDTAREGVERFVVELSKKDLIRIAESDPQAG